MAELWEEIMFAFIVMADFIGYAVAAATGVTAIVVMCLCAYRTTCCKSKPTKGNYVTENKPYLYDKVGHMQAGITKLNCF